MSELLGAKSGVNETMQPWRTLRCIMATQPNSLKPCNRPYSDPMKLYSFLGNLKTKQNKALEKYFFYNFGVQTRCTYHFDGFWPSNVG